MQALVGTGALIAPHLTFQIKDVIIIENILAVTNVLPIQIWAKLIVMNVLFGKRVRSHVVWAAILRINFLNPTHNLIP